MGLKVWLPLNGTLDNLGCTGNVITSIGSNNEWVTGGKIGGNCLHLIKASDTIAIPSMAGAKQMSFAYWVKVNNAWSENWRDGIRWYSTNGSSDTTSRQEFYTNCTRVGVWFAGSPNSNSGKVFTVGEWRHLAFVIDYSIGYTDFYIDGKLVGHTTGVNTDHYLKTGNFIIGDNDGGGVDINMNDLRIYDHCLSPAEVKEISQGLVLHYKLDSIDIKTGTNLVTGITKGGQTTLLTDGRIGVETSGTNADTYFAINLSESIVAGTSYFLSCDASGISTGQYWGFPLGQQGNSTLPFKIYNGHNEYAFTANDTLPNGNAMNWGTNRLFMDDNSRSDWANKAQFYNFQLVKISAGTELIVEDSSGYNHNGILNDTTAKILSDTQRHSAALVTSQASNSAIYPIKGECNMPESAALTFTWWMKPTTIGHQTSGIFSTSNNDLPTDYNTTAANMRDSYFDCCNTSGTCVRINVASFLTLNEWHHYALTYNGSQLNFYKDGVSKATVSQSGSLKAFKYIFPFYSKAGGANRTTSGGLSDFRIYCTALDADSIRQLYQVGAKIDNKQNWHTFEFIEGTNGNTKITKSGQTVVQGNLVNNQYYNGLIEDGDKVKINSNKTITAAEFIEA